MKKNTLEIVLKVVWAFKLNTVIIMINSYLLSNCFIYIMPLLILDNMLYHFNDIIKEMDFDHDFYDIYLII
jgi:hypothetical protein